MAKKSFNLYKSWYPLIEALYSQSPENVGALFMAIMAYQNDGTEPDITSPIYSHFCLMKQKFEEDNEAYANACESYRENGKKGGRPKKQTEPNETKENQSGFLETKPNQTKPDTDTVTETDTVNDTDNVSPTEIKEKDSPTESRKRKPLKKKYGAFGHVLLSDRDIELLYQNHGEMETQTAIDYLDAYIEEKGYKSKNHKMTLERWVFDAVKKKGHGDNRASNITPFNPTEYLLNQIREEEERRGQVGNGEDSNSNNSGVSGLFS